MDKNMIHIDDLFRDRMLDREEDERAGAWLNMRQLLDQKMPAGRVAASGGWKRYMGYITGALLITSAAVGGYQLTRPEMTVSEPAQISSASGTSAIQGLKRPVHSPLRSGAQQAANPSATPTAAAQSGIAATGSLQTAVSATGLSGAASGSAADAFSGTAGASGQQPQHNPLVAAVTGGRNHTAEDDAGVDQPGGTQAEQAASTQQSVPASATTDLQEMPVTAGSLPVHISPANSLAGHSARIMPLQAQPADVTEAAAHALAAEPGEPVKARTLPDQPRYVIRRDTIHRISLREHKVFNPVNFSSKLVIDTVAVEKLVFEQRVPLPEAPGTLLAANARKQAPSLKDAQASQMESPHSQSVVKAAPAAADPALSLADASDESLLVPLSNFRVDSRRTYAWDPARFQDIVQRTRYKMSQLQFYPGLIFGINGSLFGPNSLGGFQLGLSQLMQINNNWSVMGELKYMSRFNGGFTVNDDYEHTTSIERTEGYNGTHAIWAHKITTDSVRHYYNFSALHSLEMPVAVRYSAGRFNLFGGLNLAYNFRVNTSEVDRHYTVITHDTTISGVALNYARQDGKAKIANDDFAGRIGLGYLLGVSYQCTPAVSVDLRMVQHVWDNARGAGARQVSSDLYKIPSMQLSVGYRFSKSPR